MIRINRYYLVSWPPEASDFANTLLFAIKHRSQAEDVVARLGWRLDKKKFTKLAKEAGLLHDWNQWDVGNGKVLLPLVRENQLAVLAVEKIPHK